MLPLKGKTNVYVYSPKVMSKRFTLTNESNLGKYFKC